MIPDKIYIQAGDGKTITHNKIFDTDICYIRKDALLEWLNKAKIAANNDGIRAGFQIVIDQIK